MDFKDYTPRNLITNEVIYGYQHNEQEVNVPHGRAAGVKLGYCAYDSFGKFIPNVIVGKAAYDQVEAESLASIQPFIDHLKRIFINDPRDVDIFLDYMAFKMQYPGVKPRWAIVLAGEQGVGKDVAIDACWMKYGLNFINNISPGDVMSSYNDYLKCILLRISEVADLGEMNKWAFNERVKVIISGHPDRIQVNPKYGVKYWLTLYNGTILTTNHLDSGGFYIPEGDRRYYVIKCATWQQLGMAADYDKRAEYFDSLFNWFNTPDSEGNTGYDKIGHYLLWARDVSAFKENACPQASEAKMEAIEAGKNYPQFFLDALNEYSNAVASFPADPYAPLNIYDCDEYKLPNFINYRKFQEFAAAKLFVNGAISERVAPARLAGLLRDAGYALLPNPNNKAKKWVIGKSTEKFYYREAAVTDPKQLSDYMVMNVGSYMTNLSTINTCENLGSDF